LAPRFINDAEVYAGLTPALLLGTVEEALAGLASGAVINGGKVAVTLDDHDGARTLLALVGVLARHDAGVKWVGTFNRNAERGLPRAPATLLLTDSVTGALRAVSNVASITARRTAAALVVAAKCFDREPRRIAILGFGAIGKSLVPLVAAAFAPEAITIWGGRRERLVVNAEQVRFEYGIACTAARTPDEAVRNAGVVFTASGLTEDKPFLTRAMLSDDAVVCCAGSYQEIADDVALASGCLVADDWAACQKRGNLAAMVKRGVLTRDSIAMELPALVTRARAGNLPAARLPVVVTIGIGALDVAIAEALVGARRAD
jgi:ornithine cyclodeaminase/alanine dehydrogenase-like protein (mu-crystallin family)